MRLPVLVICFALAIPVLLSCDQQRSAADIDPELGLDCLGKHRASLPPGTQYEGIEGIVENRLTIKIRRKRTFCIR